MAIKSFAETADPMDSVRKERNLLKAKEHRIYKSLEGEKDSAKKAELRKELRVVESELRKLNARLGL